MAKIHPRILELLQHKFRISRAQAYSLISRKAGAMLLPRNLAALALASEKGINVSRFATPEDLAQLRGGIPVAAPLATPVSAPATSRRTTRRNARGKKLKSPPRRGTTVFVVHGRNLKLRDAMFTFLRAIGLKPLEWSQAIRATGQGSPYVGTILEKAFQKAAAIVVLLTPDDEAKLRKEFIVSADPTHEKKLTGQARANVLFEAGMAFGRESNSTVLVQVGEVRPFSDVAGRHILRLTNDITKRRELAVKLSNAGCNVDLDGDDWITAGDFSLH
jgi:predicted nucleotide-binding protein